MYVSVRSCVRVSIDFKNRELFKILKILVHQRFEEPWEDKLRLGAASWARAQEVLQPAALVPVPHPSPPARMLETVCCARAFVCVMIKCVVSV